ncbi:tetratricopeptide repeat protein, partial [Salmonella enterica]|uniref:tetratricopeptide repeat protein n=1 Tax=Salmonella enterica TaxID=28901 RepID=UPI00398C2F03
KRKNRDLTGRLQRSQVLQSATRLRDSGKEREAEGLLRGQPPSTRMALTLADRAQQGGDNAAARAAYDAVLALEPGNVDAMLARVEIDIAQGYNAAARAQLAALPASPSTSINMPRRVAPAQLQLGDNTAAARTFN